VSFSENVELRAAENEFKSAVEKIKSNILWKKNNFESLSNWLKNTTSKQRNELLVDNFISEHLKYFVFLLMIKL
jgi:hypothetical protein